MSDVEEEVEDDSFAPRYRRNTFRFATFTERLAEVDVNIFQELRPIEDAAEGDESYFRNELNEMVQLDCTSFFRDFVKEVRPLCMTLPHIIHHKETLVNTILTHLQVPKSTALASVLKMTVTLAKDLRMEFYPYFPKIYSTVVCLLDQSNPELLEAIFQSLGYLFKYLMKQLIRDIHNTYQGMLHLFCHKKAFVRAFAAESFAYLFKKVKNQAALHQLLQSMCSDSRTSANIYLVDGIASILFYAMKGIRHQFHSQCEKTLRDLIHSLSEFPIENQEVLDGISEWWDVKQNEVFLPLYRRYDPWFLSIFNAGYKLCNHTNSLYSEPIWDVLLSEMKEFEDGFVNGDRDSTLMFELTTVIMTEWIRFKMGTRIYNIRLLSEKLREVLFKEQIVKSKNMTEAFMEHVLFAAKALLKCRRPEVESITPEVMKEVIKSDYHQLTMKFIRQLTDEDIMTIGVCHPFVSTLCENAVPKNPNLVITFLTALRPYYLDTASAHGWKRRIQFMSKTDFMTPVLLKMIKPDKKLQVKLNELNVLWGALSVIDFVDISFDRISPLLDELIASVQKLLGTHYSQPAYETIISEKNTSSSLVAVLAQAILTKLRLHYLHRTSEYHALVAKTIEPLLKTYPQELAILKMSLDVMSLGYSDEYRSEHYSHSVLESVMGSLLPNLKSWSKEIRLATLKLLNMFEPYLAFDPREKKNMPSEVLNICIEIEETPLNATDIRSATSRIISLTSLFEAGRVPAPILPVLPNIFIGNLYTKISVIWPVARDAFCSIMNTNSSLAWPIYQHVLQSNLQYANPFEFHKIGDRRSFMEDEHSDELMNMFLKSQVITDVCTDGFTVFTFLLDIATKSIDIIEKSKPNLALIVDMFKTFIENEYKRLFIIISSESTKYKFTSKGSRNACLKKLSAFLSFFSKLKNPKKLPENEKLREIFFSLLSRPETNIQTLALDCLLTWKPRCIVPYKDNLKNMIQDDKLRAEMANFSLSEEAKEDKDSKSKEGRHCILHEDRREMIPIVIRILCAKLIHKKVSDNQKHMPKTRRKMIFSYLSQLSIDEIEPLFVLVLEHFGVTHETVRTGDFSIIRTPMSVQVAMLSMLQDVITELREYIRPYMKSILHVLLDMLETSIKIIEEERSSQPVIEPKSSKVTPEDQMQDNDDQDAGLDAESLDEEEEDDIDENNEEDEKEEDRDGKTPAKSENMDDEDDDDENNQDDGENADDEEGDLDEDDSENEDGEHSTGNKAENHRERIIFKQAKQIRLQCLKRLSDFFRRFPDLDYSKMWDKFFAVTNNQIKLIPTENNQQPVGLLECLHSMSQSEYLIPVLSNHPFALPTLFKCLVVPGTSDKVIRVVLTIVENLISVNVEIPAELHIHQVPANFEYIGKFSHELIHSMEALVTNKMKTYEYLINSRFGGRRFGKLAHMQLNILARISPHIDDADLSSRLVRLLFPFLDSPKLTMPATKDNIMLLIQSLLKNVDNALDYVSALSRYFRYFRTRDNRTNLCKIFIELEKKFAELKGLGQTVSDLNAYTKSRIGEMDYDRRLKVLHSVRDDFCQSLNIFTTPAVASNLFFFLSEEDLSIRSGASLALQRLIHFLGSVEKGATQSPNMTSEDSRTLLKSQIASCVSLTIRKFAPEYRQEYLEILSSLAEHYPAAFPGIGSIYDADPEASFYTNINHIQPHRRVRAMIKLRKSNVFQSFETITVNKIVIPILVHVIGESKKESNNVIDEAISALSAYCSKLPWFHYAKLLKKFMKQLGQDIESHRILVRTVCAILAAFHFNLDESVCREFAKHAPPKAEEEENIQLSSTSVLKPVDPNAQMLSKKESRQIVSTILRTIIPQLEKNITVSEENSNDTSVGVSVALVRLLQVLPTYILESELPRIIITLCNQLQSRSIAVRNVTRQSLREIASMLGIRYLQFIIRQLKKSLTRGYQLHILGYTVHQLLTNLQQLSAGCLDHCLNDVLEIYIDEIFGEISTQKSTSEMKKFKELKDKKAHPVFRFAMAWTTFPKNINTVTTLLEPQLNGRASPKIYAKLREVFASVSLGLCENSTANDPLVVDYVIKLANENQNAFLSAAPTKKSKKVDSMLIYNPQEKRAVSDHNRLILREFSFNLVLELMKKKRIAYGETGELNVKKLVRILPAGAKGKDTQILIITMKIYTEIFASKVPLVSGFAHPIIERTFKMVQKLVSSSSEVAQCCFNLLTVAVRDLASFHLTDEQLSQIVSIALVDLEKPEKHAMTFNLISAIVTKKIVCPELYTLMEKLANMMVKAQIPSTQTKCGNIFFKFMTEYPLTGSILNRYFTYLTTNLVYEYPTGRKAVLQFLIKIFSRIAPNVLCEYLDILFYPLVLRLVNDSDQECRELVSKAIKTLIEELPFDKLDSLFKAGIKWSLSSEKPQLKRAATQVLGFFVEVGKVDAFQTINQIRPVIDGAVNAGIQLCTDGEEPKNDEEWKSLYYHLIMFEKLVGQKPSVFWVEFKDITLKFWELLAYPHAWVQTSVTRLLGIYFASIGDDFDLNNPTCVLLKQPNFVYQITQKHCKLLSLESLTETWSQQVAKNIVFLSGIMVKFPEICETNKAREDEIEGQHEGDGGDSDGEDEKKRSGVVSNVGLNWLLHRLSYMGRFGDKVHRLAIFKILIAMPSKYGNEPFEPYLHLVVSPFYRTTLIQDPHLHDDVRMFAQEALGLLRIQFKESFVAATDRVRRVVEGIRRKRKIRDAQEAVADPQGYAAKKLRQKQKRTEAKKKAKKAKRDEL